MRRHKNNLGRKAMIPLLLAAFTSAMVVFLTRFTPAAERGGGGVPAAPSRDRRSIGIDGSQADGNEEEECGPGTSPGTDGEAERVSPVRAEEPRALTAGGREDMRRNASPACPRRDSAIPAAARPHGRGGGTPQPAAGKRQSRRDGRCLTVIGGTVYPAARTSAACASAERRRRQGDRMILHPRSTLLASSTPVDATVSQGAARRAPLLAQVRRT